MTEQIRKVFTDVQQNKVQQEKYIELLKNIYESVTDDEFLEEFWRCLQHMFQTPLKSITTAHHNVMSFVVNFCIKIAIPVHNVNGTDEFPIFFTNILYRVLSLKRSPLMQVHYFVCNFVKLLLNNMNEVEYLNHKLCTKIEKAILRIMEDRHSTITVEAIHALYKLQNLHTSECKIINAYIDYLNNPTIAVRKAALTNLAACRKSVPHIAAKVCDPNKSVRSQAFEKCASISPKYFSIIERQAILIAGFQEEDDTTKTFFLNTLIPNWLNTYNNDFIKFIEALNSEQTKNNITEMDNLINNLLSCILKKYEVEYVLKVLPIDSNKIINRESLNVNVLSFWKKVIQHLKESSNGEALQKVLPDVGEISSVIETFLERPSNATDEMEETDEQRILKQLCEIVQYCDLDEEGGRRNLNKLLVSLLKKPKFHADVVECAMKTLKVILKTPEALNDNIFIIINDIEADTRKPQKSLFPENEYELRKLQCKLLTVENAFENARKEADYRLQQQLSDEIQQIQDEIDKLNYKQTCESTALCQNSKQSCLTIINALIKLNVWKQVPARINEFKEKHLSELQDTDDAQLDPLTLEFLSLCAIIDKENADSYLVNITRPLIRFVNCTDTLKDALLTSINATTDLLLLYGADLFGDDNDGRTLYQNNHGSRETPMNAHYFSEIIMDLVSHEDPDVAECAGLSMLKLIGNNQSVSSNLLTRVILKWFNPFCGFDNAINQQMGSALLDYANKVEDGSEFQKCILSILNKISTAHKNSTLSSIDTNRLFEFLCIMLKQITLHCPRATCSLMHVLLKEISTSDSAALLVKILSSIGLPNHRSSVNKLIESLSRTLTQIEDLPIKPHLEKYLAKLELHVSSLPEGNDQDEDVNFTENDSDIASETGANPEPAGITESDGDFIPETDYGSNPSSDRSTRRSVLSENQQNNIIQKSLRVNLVHSPCVLERIRAAANCSARTEDVDSSETDENSINASTSGGRHLKRKKKQQIQGSKLKVNKTSDFQQTATNSNEAGRDNRLRTLRKRTQNSSQSSSGTSSPPSISRQSKRRKC